jgi:hypothetical protein
MKKEITAFNEMLYKNEEIRRIATFHKKTIYEVVRAIQPYISVNLTKGVYLDFFEKNSKVQIKINKL